MREWTAGELYYMLNHVRTLGEKGIRQVAKRLQISTTEVRREYERQCELLKGVISE